MSQMFCRYENKGVQWLKSKPSLPPGLNPSDAPVPEKKDSEPMSKSAKKNAKRKEKKKQQNESQPNNAIHSLTQSMAQTNIHLGPPKNTQQASGSSKPTNSSDKQEVLKKVRQLRKKLKQIEDLERRIESGELKDPEKDQLEKISKKSVIVAEMEDLQLELDE